MLPIFGSFGSPACRMCPVGTIVVRYFDLRRVCERVLLDLGLCCFGSCTPQKFNIAPENWPLVFQPSFSRGELLKFRECTFRKSCPSSSGKSFLQL